MNTKKIYSLFVGRYQPFHRGHEILVRKVLDEGRNVCIALRDTEISENDPYTIEERTKQIEESLSDCLDRIKIITIPDIEEVCYGRKVGWGIRQLFLGEEIEKISATEIRRKK